MGRLKRTVDEEFRKAGFVNLGLVGAGPELIFSRRPIESMADLKATTLWTWDVDDTLGPGLDGMGLRTVHAGLDVAGRLYDEGKVDGFVSAPAAALAFQWSAQSRYLLPLRLAMLHACAIIANRAFDPLPEEYKAAIRHAAARGLGHLEQESRAQDDALLNGLFARQGLKTLKVSPHLRAQFFDEARGLRERMADRLVPRALLDRVLSLLADYRAEHREGEGY
jgi:TRAP-type C4-dicarboxylate transport system substrate-binding protein